jgi:hypothetical protein
MLDNLRKTTASAKLFSCGVIGSVGGSSGPKLQFCEHSIPRHKKMYRTIKPDRQDEENVRSKSLLQYLQIISAYNREGNSDSCQLT